MKISRLIAVLLACAPLLRADLEKDVRDAAPTKPDGK